MDACCGAADMLLLCTLLWPEVICLYAYTFSFLASLVSVQVEKEPITVSACMAQQQGRWPQGSWWTSRCVQKAVRKDLFFSPIHHISTCAGQEGVREMMWGRTSVSIFLQMVVIHMSSLQHLPLLCYFVSFWSDCFTERQRTDSRIKSKLLWKCAVCGSIWSSGER